MNRIPILFSSDGRSTFMDNTFKHYSGTVMVSVIQKPYKIPMYDRQLLETIANTSAVLNTDALKHTKWSSSFL